MTSHPRAALLTALLISALLCPPILAQTSEPPSTVQDALQEFRDAPNYQKPEKRKAVVGFGAEAVPLLIGEIQKAEAMEDPNLVSNCIIALGALKAEEATDALVAVLEGTNVQVGYLAAVALGDVWEGKGTTDAATKKVNAVLLAMLYSETTPEAVYGPAGALVKINGIAAVQRPENLPPDQLLAEMDTWANANSAALPPADQQPWQLNLRTLLTSRDPNTRQGALQALRQKRALGPIEQALAALEKGTSSETRQDLAVLLGELAGVTFPPPGMAPDASPQEQVAAWRDLWLAELKRQSGSRHVALAWYELERNLRRFDQDPSDETGEGVKDYRGVLIDQLSGPDDIPVDTSPTARELLEPPLMSKKLVSDAMSVLEGRAEAYQRSMQLRIIEDEARKAHGKDVGLQFLGRLAALGRVEADGRVAVQIGMVLGLVSGIPCELGGASLADRRNQLDEWLGIIRMIGLPVTTPGQ